MAEVSEAAASPKELIAEIVARIVNRFAPEKIILFGSHATGTARPDSDVDLLVVMKGERLKRKKATEIDLVLMGIDFPVDVIVVEAGELDRGRDYPGTVINSALREGKILYDRHV